MLLLVSFVCLFVGTSYAGVAEDADSHRTAKVITLARDHRLINTDESISSVTAFCSKYNVTRADVALMLVASTSKAPEKVHYSADLGPHVRVGHSTIPNAGLGTFLRHRVVTGDLLDVEEANNVWSLGELAPDTPFVTDCCGDGVLNHQHHADSIETPQGTAWEFTIGLQAFTNHNADPNCDIIPIVVHALESPGTCPLVTGGRYALFAARDMDMNTELTIDYGLPEVGGIVNDGWA